METIRICEESEARLLLREGTLMDYVKMWSEKFPQKDMNIRGRLLLIRDISNDLGCKLLEAKQLIDSLGNDYPQLADSVIFEVGSYVRITKAGNVLSLYVKRKKEWFEGDMNWLGSVENELDLFPVREENEKARRRPQRIEFGAF